ncbi:MAG: hypothetical protein D6730_22795 [Bacteroidetes bacterium]|nr:MAG: hypothetical protein D6730_22795 [Bacteroidota bacterium]
MKHPYTYKHWLVALLLLGSVGCNPFAPSLDPNGLAGINLLGDPTNIEGYFQFFQNAYELRDTSLYAQLFTSDFVFTYYDFEQGQEISWDRATELNISYNLFQAVQQINLDWNFYNQLDSTATEAFVIRNFNLTIVENEETAFTGSGRAKFWLRRQQAGLPWKAYKWFDDSDF